MDYVETVWHRTSIMMLSAVFISLLACNTSTKNKNEKPGFHTATLKQDSLNMANQPGATLKLVPDNSKPVWGYRFVVSGDFDGDGKKEQLTEHFFSGLDNKETNKFYDGLSGYDQLIELTINKKPLSFVTCNNKRIDTLPISSGRQLLGLSYLKNEGDLNGDGTDEISFVVNWADLSNLNTWHIMTYRTKKWEELYSFPIWDWQIPDLPETFNQYGLIGLENKIIHTSNDTTNQQSEQQLRNFAGLVKKLSVNRIRVIYRNKEAEEDTLTVNLQQLKNKVN